jgi:hypothetical protein
MALIFFWLKIAVRRIVHLFKISPVVVIGTALFILALFFTKTDLKIILDTQKFIILISGFFILSFILSLKKYDLISSLVLYSKSNFTNKIIYSNFFICRAIINNVLLLIFDFFVLIGIINIEKIIYLPVITVFSILFSFLIMLVKNKYYSRKIYKIKTNKVYVNPVLKSTFHDYFTSDFFQMAAITFALFIVIIVELIKNGYVLLETEKSYLLLIGLTAVLSLGFMGIVDSILKANWKFYAVIFPADFKYHVKRTFSFLVFIFCLPIAVFIFTGLLFGISILIKYLYCLVLILFISMGIGFTTGNMFVKAIGLLLAITLILWLSTLPFYYLIFPLFFLLSIILKAKNEYTERYYL